MQHGLDGIQPLFDAGNRCGVGGHGGALRGCLRTMLTAMFELGLLPIFKTWQNKLPALMPT
jgi:hypothetical protein